MPRSRLLWLVLLLAHAGMLRAAAGPAPLDAFAAAPQTTNVAISPRRALLAWCSTNGDDVRVVVFDTSTQKYILSFPINSALSVPSLTWESVAPLQEGVRFRYRSVRLLNK